LATILRN